MEGGLFWWLVGGVGVGITVFFVLLVMMNTPLLTAFLAALVPVGLCLAYIFGFRQGKPPGYARELRECPSVVEGIIHHANCRKDEKTKLITNVSKLFFVALVAGLFAGCAATRPISDVTLGAGGAYLGNKLSNGDPLATAVGAAGGVIVSEGLHFAAKKQSDKAYAARIRQGPERRREAAVLALRRHAEAAQPGQQVRLHPVQLPEQRIDGVTFQPAWRPERQRHSDVA